MTNTHKRVNLMTLHVYMLYATLHISIMLCSYHECVCANSVMPVTLRVLDEREDFEEEEEEDESRGIAEWEECCHG